MLEIAVLALVLVAVFAAKAASVLLAADDTISKSTSFSWLVPTAEDAIVPAAEMEGSAEHSAAIPVQGFSPRARIA